MKRCTLTAKAVCVCWARRCICSSPQTACRCTPRRTRPPSFPGIPALFDSELPSPAALLLHALALADGFRPEAGYREAAHTLWAAAAPYARQQPLACAA